MGRRGGFVGKAQGVGNGSVGKKGDGASQAAVSPAVRRNVELRAGVSCAPDFIGQPSVDTRLNPNLSATAQVSTTTSDL